MSHPDFSGQQWGEYRLVRVLGMGEFGLVYLAQHVFLPRRQAAIKVLLHTTPAERTRLLEEANKIADWSHRHIIQVLTFSEYQSLPYLVLQYAPSGTLKEHYPLGQVFPIETILPHVQQIAEGLQYAHDHQTLHLDLKPANVLLDDQQDALISDFGISVILRPDQSHLSILRFRGTPVYAAPEQFDEGHGHATPATDQYALATMVYQWLTGRLPFQGAFLALATRKALDDPPTLGAGVAPAIEQVVLKALAKDPHARYPSVREFAQALAQAAREPPVGTLLLTLKGDARSVDTVAWSPDGRHLASASRDDKVRLWDAATGEPLTTLSGHFYSVHAVAWSPDGRRLASASGGWLDNTVRLWDAVTGAPLATLAGHSNAVRAITWSPDGRRLASASGSLLGKSSDGESSDNTVRLWDAEKFLPITTLTGHTDSVVAVAWSPDGRRLASASYDQTVRLWNTESFQMLATLAGHTSAVWAVAWAPDGRRIASASGSLFGVTSDNTVRLWDAESFQPVTTLSGHKDAVGALAWSPDGRRLASASDDKTVCLWDAASLQLVFCLTGHSHAVRAITWSPDGRRLASASVDQKVRVWWVG